jgi:hypothetical protein
MVKSWRSVVLCLRQLRMDAALRIVSDVNIDTRQIVFVLFSVQAFNKDSGIIATCVWLRMDA